VRPFARSLLPLLAALAPVLAESRALPAAPDRPRDADAAEGSCALSVSARVVPYVRLESVRQDAELEVTSAEIARGYVEVWPAARLSVRTNSVEGYFVNFELHGGVIRRAEVFGLAREASLEPGRGRVRRVPAEIPRDSLDLGFRFHLAPDTRPGVYPWPVSISLSALDGEPSGP